MDGQMDKGPKKDLKDLKDLNIWNDCKAQK